MQSPRHQSMFPSQDLGEDDEDIIVYNEPSVPELSQQRFLPTPVVPTTTITKHTTEPTVPRQHTTVSRRERRRRRQERRERQAQLDASPSPSSPDDHGRQFSPSRTTLLPRRQHIDDDHHQGAFASLMELLPDSQSQPVTIAHEAAGTAYFRTTVEMYDKENHKAAGEGVVRSSKSRVAAAREETGHGSSSNGLSARGHGHHHQSEGEAPNEATPEARPKIHVDMNSSPPDFSMSDTDSANGIQQGQEESAESVPTTRPPPHLMSKRKLQKLRERATSRLGNAKSPNPDFGLLLSPSEEEEGVHSERRSSSSFSRRREKKRRSRSSCQQRKKRSRSPSSRRRTGTPPNRTSVSPSSPAATTETQNTSTSVVGCRPTHWHRRNNIPLLARSRTQQTQTQQVGTASRPSSSSLQSTCTNRRNSLAEVARMSLPPAQQQRVPNHPAPQSRRRSLLLQPSATAAARAKSVSTSPRNTSDGPHQQTRPVSFAPSFLPSSFRPSSTSGSQHASAFNNNDPEDVVEIPTSERGDTPPGTRMSHSTPPAAAASTTSPTWNRMTTPTSVFTSPPMRKKRKSSKNATVGPLSKRFLALHTARLNDALRLQNSSFGGSFYDPRRLASTVTDVTILAHFGGGGGSSNVSTTWTQSHHPSDEQHKTVLALVHRHGPPNSGVGAGSTTKSSALHQNIHENTLVWACFPLATATSIQLAQGVALRIYNAVIIQCRQATTAATIGDKAYECRHILICTHLSECYPAGLEPLPKAVSGLGLAPPPRSRDDLQQQQVLSKD